MHAYLLLQQSSFMSRFASYRLPNQLISDNRLQFIVLKFKNFLVKN